MPTKDLIGRPRPTPAQRALERAMIRHIQNMVRRRRGERGDDGLTPAVPPSGPRPTPLIGGAEAVMDDPPEL